MTNGYRGGVSSTLLYAYEDADAWGEAAASMTASDETYLTLGQGVDVNVTRSNNKVRNFGVGARNAPSTSALQFSSTATFNGAISNFYWLLGTLGANADAGSGPTYTHTYTEADLLPTFSAKRPVSFATEEYELLQGCVINQATISASLNEVAKFSLECPVRYTSIVTSSTTFTADAYEVFTFAGGTIEIPNGTTIAAIQNFELTIANNVDLVYGVGSRFATGFAAKTREYNIKFTAAITDFALLKQFYDGTTGTEPGTGVGAIASMQLTFTNPSGDSLVMTFGETHFDEDTLPTNATDVIKEDITGWANSLTDAVYTNGTAAAPAAATNVA